MFEGYFTKDDHFFVFGFVFGWIPGCACARRNRRQQLVRAFGVESLGGYLNRGRDLAKCYTAMVCWLSSIIYRTSGLVIWLNGIPLRSVESKRAWEGVSSRFYRLDRFSRWRGRPECFANYCLNNSRTINGPEHACKNSFLCEHLDTVDPQETCHWICSAAPK